MQDKPKIIIFEQQVAKVGEDIFIDSSANDSGNSVLFEDNGETGYFYALDRDNELEILDALHIYDVVSVIDKEKPSTFKILWTEDSSKAFLSINNYYHAIFDFKNKAGYCRNGFPKSNGKWALISERTLTDDLIEKISKSI